MVEATHGGQKTILCPADEKPIAEVAWADEADALKALEAAKMDLNIGLHCVYLKEANGCPNCGLQFWKRKQF